MGSKVCLGALGDADQAYRGGWMVAGRARRGSQPFGGAAETSSAVVYFAGDRAYKLKKPVDLGFLDFTTLEARARACQRETELNRRFAPDVYQGEAEVAAPDGTTCDYLVAMRRMPDERRLSRLVTGGADAAEPVRQVARILATQHAAAPRSAQIAEQGSRDALLRRWDANLREAASMAGPLDAQTIAETGQLARRFIAGRTPLFETRLRDGRIVDGHGDLLADDIFCLDDGPRILDCLDFDDRLRWLDGLDDAACLAMDLERLGARQLGRQFAGWYAEFSGDPAPASLLQHYIAYRAFVRAKVACVRARQGDPQAVPLAWQLAELTLRHLRAGAVTLTLIGGLPGTGKTTLAGALADRLGWTVLCTDRIRKELAGIPAQRAAATAGAKDAGAEEAGAVPYGSGIYSESWTDRTYAELLKRAGELLASGESVIADGSWISAAYRAGAAEAAAHASAELVQLRCTAARELAAQRIGARQQDLSDADADIAAQMASAAEPWPAAVTLITDPAGAPISGDGFGGLVQQALEVIRPHGPEHVWRPAQPVMLPD